MRRPKVKLDNLTTFMTVAERHNIEDAANDSDCLPLESESR